MNKSCFKLLMLAFVLAWSPIQVLGTPIYNCKDATGKSVYQQAPCSADKLDSLANVPASNIYKREELSRKEFVKKLSEDQKRTESERIEKEKTSVIALKGCLEGERISCDIDIVAYMIKGLTMDAVENLFGRAREQRVNGDTLYYYSIKIYSGRYTLQLSYEMNGTSVGNGRQVGYVVSRVNYY